MRYKIYQLIRSLVQYWLQLQSLIAFGIKKNCLPLSSIPPAIGMVMFEPDFNGKISIFNQVVSFCITVQKEMTVIGTINEKHGHFSLCQVL